MVKQVRDPLDVVFGAFADPTRRAILERLAEGGATVTELAQPFEMSLPAVSKHLRVLETAGLIQRRVEGRVHRLGMLSRPIREATSWLEAHRRYWEARLDALEEYVEETVTKAEPSWKRRKSLPARPSTSNGSSRHRRKGSSRPGRKPRR